MKIKLTVLTIIIALLLAMGIGCTDQSTEEAMFASFCMEGEGSEDTRVMELCVVAPSDFYQLSETQKFVSGNVEEAFHIKGSYYLISFAEDETYIVDIISPLDYRSNSENDKYGELIKNSPGKTTGLWIHKTTIVRFFGENNLEKYDSLEKHNILGYFYYYDLKDIVVIK